MSCVVHYRLSVKYSGALLKYFGAPFSTHEGGKTSSSATQHLSEPENEEYTFSSTSLTPPQQDSSGVFVHIIYIKLYNN